MSLASFRRSTILGVLVALVIGFAPGLVSAQTIPQFNVVPISISSVTIQNGGLVASGIVGGNTFTAPLAVTATPNPTGACPILNLSLAPIHLGLLGLNVDTSSICLDVTAYQGRGLLGDLLCGVANLLNGGTSLADVLAGLSPEQATRLNAGLTSVLNQAVFTPISRSPALVGASCTILNLALGPLDLQLLGLRVELDNCADPPGPVTLDITATPGAGNLLGNLLCGLTGILDNLPAAAWVLSRISWVIGILVS